MLPFYPTDRAQTESSSPFAGLALPLFQRKALSQQQIHTALREVGLLADSYKIPKPTLVVSQTNAYSYSSLALYQIGLCRLSTSENFRSLVHREMAHLAQGKFIAAAMRAPAEWRRLPDGFYSAFNINRRLSQAACKQELHLHLNSVRLGERLLLSRYAVRALDRQVNETMDPTVLDSFLAFRENSLIELGPTIQESLTLRHDLSTAAAELRGAFTAYSEVSWRLPARLPFLASYALRQRGLTRQIANLDEKIDALLESLGKRYETGNFDPMLPWYIAVPTI